MLLLLLLQDEATDGLVEAALALLESDKSKDVRIAVVATLPLNAASLPHILRRARDVSPQVRKALVARLGSLSLRVLRCACWQPARAAPHCLAARRQTRAACRTTLTPPPSARWHAHLLPQHRAAGGHHPAAAA